MANLQKTRLTKAIRQAQLNPNQRTSSLAVSIKLRNNRNKPERLVYLKITYKGRETLVSTGVRALPAHFNHKTATINGNPEGTAIVQMARTSVFQVYEQLRLIDQPITVDLIRDTLVGLIMHDAGTVRVSMAIDKHLSYQQERVKAGDIDSGTYDWKSRSNKLFLVYISHAHRNTVCVDEILPADAGKFMTWLKVNKSHSHNYTIKVLSAAKEMLNFAVDNKWIEHNPFFYHRNQKEYKRGEVLTEKEVTELVDINLFAPALMRVRDVFMFQVYTGLSYRDVLDLKSSHIMTTDKGQRYIWKPRQKTGNPSIIPLIPQAELLLEKYTNEEYCRKAGVLMPVISNQKMNHYLKQIGGIVNLKKRLTSHVARRTCATIFINNGVPLNTVAMVLGHSSTIMTERHYAQVQPETVIREINSFLQRKAE